MEDYDWLGYFPDPLPHYGLRETRPFSALFSNLSPRFMEHDLPR
jgi:hypothetical protein